MTNQDSATTLPKLRADIALLRGAPTAAGEPSWLIHDPLQNRFVQIDFATHEILRRWTTCDTTDDLIRTVSAGNMVSTDRESIEELIAFLFANRLTVDAPGRDWRHFARETENRHQSLPKRLLHNYLFFRIPLCRPQAFLEYTLPLIRPLTTRSSRAVIMCLGLIGIYLISREWDTFTTSLEAFFTWEGVLLMALVLGVVKAAHELGHAYTAVAYGCRVHTMGIAFVLMAPLLYTDVTDSWRLRDRRKRLAIDSAGIKVELAIAAIAIFLWAFLPDGPYRSVAFTLSVVSVASSLVVNLNPFMRFDGYYLLSDFLALDNLQSRAFAFGRWKLREILFGLRDAPPEIFSPRLRTCLILYAWVTWIYRLVLFIGIALLVYSYFFKVLGIALFVVEIIFFVGRPIMNELKTWYKERWRIMASYRTFTTMAVGFIFVSAGSVPWSTQVEIPSVIESAYLQPIHAGRPARIEKVHVRQGSWVKAGDPLVTLVAPELNKELDLVQRKLALARLTHDRRGANSRDLERTIVLESSISGLFARIAGLQTERSELTLRAPFDGQVVELESSLHRGRWVSPKDPLAAIAMTGAPVLRGYVSEHDLWRIAPGSSGTFVPEELSRPSLPVKIDQIAEASANEIKIASLASAHSGRISVIANEWRNLVPKSAQYQVRMTTSSDQVPRDLSVRGVVLAQGVAESALARIWRRTLNVLVRESGV